MNFFAKLALGAFLAALPGAVTAQQTDSAPQATPPLLTEADSLDPFKWIARPVIVFADSPNDPRFIEQINLLQQRPEALLERDVVVIADTDPANPSEIRRQLRPRGFSLVLVGKDGQIELRKPEPWDVRELTHAIDKMPLRQQEIRDANRAGSG
ncbi:hypothetical protein DKT77_05125 [Meridianimarinicoccus roseus]|uniref:DUF4174 domain-containing protein n=1 Tax=Meridianimarinicoccus roseus TaxID=2072018 RepID=A0A2V2LKV9_9RHOB|nr:DUF4174 domain-containing protein [Meridianimarinicoccus roseus]PWR03717.1 hypothetical protein DKT77_05125 [Meridianimarinicoccus roseus]